MDVKIIIKKINGSPVEETDILSFSFIKDAYVPYTSLSARIYAGDDTYMSISEILFYVGGKLVHHGLIDSLERTVSHGKCIVTLASRGFTSLLSQNQIAPGMYSAVSFNKLMDGFYTLPNVTHEDNSDESNYIFVKNNSSMWDGIANLAYKLCGTYPYIRDTNCVRITPEENPSVYSYDSDTYLASGCTYSYKRRISNFHMADIDGNYGTYDYEDVNVLNRQIVRHKYFELDRQFLYSPEEAAVYRSKLADRAHFRYFCKYCGYNGEDLFDKVSFDYVNQRRITSVEITGNSKGIFTEIGVYYDGFLGL